jgi:hypothetical protein
LALATGFTNKGRSIRLLLYGEHSPSAISGPNWAVRDLGSLAMFQIPAYDPVAIVMMGFGVLFVAALAFVL